MYLQNEALQHQPKHKKIRLAGGILLLSLVLVTALPALIADIMLGDNGSAASALAVVIALAITFVSLAVLTVTGVLLIISASKTKQSAPKLFIWLRVFGVTTVGLLVIAVGYIVFAVVSDRQQNSRHDTLCKAENPYDSELGARWGKASDGYNCFPDDYK